MEALHGLKLGQSGVSDIEGYSKLIAMTVIGAEEAIGSSMIGGFVNLVARRLEEELGVPRGVNVAELLSWMNSNTMLRLNTYRVKGRLVRDEDKGPAFYMIAYECPIRQVLYLEDLPGGRSLCMIVCRLLSRLLSESLGSACKVVPTRIGPNACLLRAGISSSVREKIEGIDVVSSSPDVEEYEELLNRFFSALLHSIGWALNTLLGGNPAMSYRAGKSYGRLVGASILAQGYEATTLEEAVEVFNSAMQGFLRIRAEDSAIVIEENKFDEIISREGIEHAEFIKRIVQGFIAGSLETLLARRVDLRSLGNKFEVIIR